MASRHPESAIHWLAVPVERVPGTEMLERENSARFVELVEFALKETCQQEAIFPNLIRGFTIKAHFGSFETIPHAKLHVLCVA